MKHNSDEDWNEAELNGNEECLGCMYESRGGCMRRDPWCGGRYMMGSSVKLDILYKLIMDL